jgi:hypothetical protein
LNSSLSHLRAGITGVHHHTRLRQLLKWLISNFWSFHLTFLTSYDYATYYEHTSLGTALSIMIYTCYSPLEHFHIKNYSHLYADLYGIKYNQSSFLPSQLALTDCAHPSQSFSVLGLNEVCRSIYTAGASHSTTALRYSVQLCQHKRQH